MQVRIDWTEDKATPGNKGITTTPQDVSQLLDFVAQLFYAPEINLLIYNPDKGVLCKRKSA